MDFDCGLVFDGVSVEEMVECVLWFVFEMVLGKEMVSEELGFGDVEFVLW